MTDRFTITNDDAKRILNALDADENYASSAFQVHTRCDLWAKQTCRQKLNALVHQGRVRRKQRPDLARRGEFAWVYWKAATAPPVVMVETTVLGAG